MKQQISLRGQIAKVDPAQHLVFGWFSVVSIDGRPVTDLQGDQIDAADLEASAYEFVLDVRSTTGENHTVRGVGRLVESVVFTPEKIHAMTQSLREQGIEANLDLPAVAWWGGMRIESEEVWARITDGTLKAFSIGGEGYREEIREPAKVEKIRKPIVVDRDAIAEAILREAAEVSRREGISLAAAERKLWSPSVIQMYEQAPLPDAA